VNPLEILKIAEKLKFACVRHTTFDQAVKDISSQLLILDVGEVLAIVGPSRVGKSRAARQAFAQAIASRDGHSKQSVVWIDNENSQANGEYSTKAFMQYACEVIKQPIYGRSGIENQSLALRRDALIARTPEGRLRNAFEVGLKEIDAKYLVVDEAHHVGYAKGGAKVASAIFDSWKCLAHKSGVVLIVIGSYGLVDIIGRVPHFIGRQRPLEVPRYKDISIDDLVSFRGALQAFSDMLRPVLKAGASLLDWDRYLFEGSLGCVGHLSLWLRSALGWMASHDCSYMTKAVLQEKAFTKAHRDSLQKEISDGEVALKRFHGDEKRGEESEKENAGQRDAVSRSNQDDKPEKRTKVGPKRKPYQRIPRRNVRGGRS